MTSQPHSRVRCLLLAALVLAQTTRPVRAADDVSLQGEVSVTADGQAKAATDASNVVVWLTPLNAAETTVTAPSKKYEMIQKDKVFSPALLVVPIGSSVAFPNLDPWFHNVFSLYRGKRFDLGLYQAGDRKAVRFDRPGPSYIFCNIHPEMAAMVFTVDSPYYGVTDRAGRVVISAVPAGQYRMHVWSENADPATLQTLERDVTVSGDDHSLPGISLAAKRHETHEHKNKYGQPYATKPLEPNY
jgi:plastocyanin